MWTEIFDSIGDRDSANAMEQGASDDQSHYRAMISMITDIGKREAGGGAILRKAA